MFKKPISCLNISGDRAVFAQNILFYTQNYAVSHYHSKRENPKGNVKKVQTAKRQ